MRTSIGRGWNVVVFGVALGCRAPSDGASGSGDDGSGSASTSAQGTSAATGMSATGSGTSTSGGEATGSGGATQPECAVDEDCQLGLCCVCNAFPATLEPPPCADDCDSPECLQAGIDTAVCRVGQCIPQKVRCDVYAVTCDEPAPECPQGFGPVVADGCWTGECVRWTLCMFVPDCAACQSNQICVQQLAGPSTEFTPIVCEPIPAGCEDDPTCACAGVLCEGIGDCNDGGERSITCIGA